MPAGPAPRVRFSGDPSSRIPLIVGQALHLYAAACIPAKKLRREVPDHQKIADDTSKTTANSHKFSVIDGSSRSNRLYGNRF
jgi:hypothetical protein